MAGVGGEALAVDLPLYASPGSASLRTSKSRVSKPRTVAHVNFKAPFGSSCLPGAWPIRPDGSFASWPQKGGLLSMAPVVSYDPCREPPATDLEAASH